MSLPAAPVGVLTIGRKRPGFDQQWNEMMRHRAAEAMAATGVKTSGLDAAAVVDEQTRAMRSTGCAPPAARRCSCSRRG